MRRRRARPEEALQRAIVEWHAFQKPNALLIHVPNGGRRGKAEAGIFKALGVRAGVHDLLLLWPGAASNSNHPIARIGWIELKRPDRKPRPSPKQTQFQALMAFLGIPTAIVTSLDQYRAMLKAWNIPPRSPPFASLLDLFLTPIPQTRSRKPEFCKFREKPVQL